MPTQTETDRQIELAVAAVHDCLGETVVAIYLGGSAGSGKLQPQSDIDLLVVVDRSLTDDRRKALLKALLQLSGRHPARPNGPRCLDVSVFCRSELADGDYPPRAEFIYGEWLREIYEAGERPVSVQDPDNTLVLAQIRRESLPLHGPPPTMLLPEVLSEQVRHAIRDALPAMLDSLHGDERNVLLTLARMWHTAETGAFVSKATAADWAIPQLDDRNAGTLEYACKAYLGKNIDEWSSRSGDAQRLAECLSGQVTKSL